MCIRDSLCSTFLVHLSRCRFGQGLSPFDAPTREEPIRSVLPALADQEYASSSGDEGGHSDAGRRGEIVDACASLSWHFHRSSPLGDNRLCRRMILDWAALGAAIVEHLVLTWQDRTP